MSFVYCENRIRRPNPDPFKALKEPFIEVPCGDCILCRLKQRKEWTLRLRLEASLYKENCFVTLTYDPKFVPPEVYVRDIQLFMKRLRKNSKLKFRFYSVAEYGDHTQRPHFHIILFGYPLDKCDIIESTWGLGFVEFSPLTDARCSYSCGYTQKKYDKKMDKSLFTLFPYLSYQERLELYLNCSDILEKKYKKKLDPRRAEFATCSLGIGKGYLEKNFKKIKEEFCIHFGGKRYSIPRYFRKQIEKDDPDWVEQWREHMQEYAKQQMLALFDKASLEFEEQSVDLGEISVPIEFESYVQKLWDDFVQHKAETIKRKRELRKKNKEI